MGVERKFKKRDALMKHIRSHWWKVLNKPCRYCGELEKRMDNHLAKCSMNPKSKKNKKTK